MKEHGFAQRPLEQLKGRKVPRYMLFTDTETHAENIGGIEIQKFTLGWIFSWDSRSQDEAKYVTSAFFDKPDAYCRYIETQVERLKTVNIYAHNIFFDLQCVGFFEYFTDKGWMLDWVYDKGLTYILRIVKSKLKIMILSTTNYYDCSLKELGRMIGLEKMDIDFEGCSLKQLKTYCYRDTEIVMHGVWYFMHFVRDNDLGSMAITKSSQAFKAYRTRFMRRKIFLHSEDRSFAVERAAYMGGRTEAFYIGAVPGHDFIILDVNRMYPYVMSKYKYPAKLVCLMDGENIESYLRWLGSYSMIAEVDLDTPEPAFAYRDKKKLIFPVGRFRTFLCTEGLKYAVKRGYVKAIIRASLYQPEDLFTDYVKYFGELRIKYEAVGNLIMSKLCKYMLNSLYGKWGERDMLTDMSEDNSGEPYLHREIWDSVYGGWWSETHLMNKIVMTHPGGEGPHSLPAIAASITENARMELWNLIRSIGTDKVLYCDTDSVIIRASDFDKVTWPVSDTELGAVKVQGRYSGLQIDGVKNYRTDSIRHIKGIPYKATETDPGVFTYDSFQRQAGCLRDGRLTGVKITEVTRRLTHSYDKGLVDADGKVTPYRLVSPETP